MIDDVAAVGRLHPSNVVRVRLVEGAALLQGDLGMTADFSAMEETAIIGLKAEAPAIEVKV